MTPKEKAKELFNRFSTLETDYEYSVSYAMTKEMTLIAVEEVINSMTVATSVYLPYWQQVKNEIEKL